MGRLERKLDVDLIERIEASGSQAKAKPAFILRKVRNAKLVPCSAGARPAATYRGARRTKAKARRRNIRNARKEQSAVGSTGDNHEAI